MTAAPGGQASCMEEGLHHRTQSSGGRTLHAHGQAPAGAPAPAGPETQHHRADDGTGRHLVRLSVDESVMVAEDEPQAGAVKDDITEIEARRESRLRKYFDKWRGGIDTAPPFPTLQNAAVTWLGAFVGILVVSVTDYFLWQGYGFRVLVASFGASAVLVYGVPESKLAQPRNLLGGQLVSAVVGVCVRLALSHMLWLAAPLGMSLALLAMQLTRTTHPPGGATALIACSIPVLPPWSGFQLVLAVLLGSAELLVVGLLISNLHKGRAYPTYWWGA